VCKQGYACLIVFLTFPDFSSRSGLRYSVRSIRLGKRSLPCSDCRAGLAKRCSLNFPRVTGVEVAVLENSGNQVRVGIEAPADVHVVREELVWRDEFVE